MKPGRYIPSEKVMQTDQENSSFEYNPKTLNKYGFSSNTKTMASGSSYNVTLIREREQKWFEMLKNWDHSMIFEYEKVKKRCRKGIPHSLRAAAWRVLCGGADLQEQNSGKFEELLKEDSTWSVPIEKDLHRTYKMHELFAERGGMGQTELFKVLHAYSVYNSKVGYCQGMSSLAGILLMLMPAEQAFWCLVSIMRKYLPGYYSEGLLAIQLDARVMESLVRDINPEISIFLDKQGMQCTFYCIDWFMCVYTRTLPWETVLRVWDIFLCEGVKVLIKVGVTILLLAFSEKQVREKCSNFGKTIKYLKYRLPQRLLQEDYFINELLSLQISDKKMKETHLSQLANLREICEQ